MKVWVTEFISLHKNPTGYRKLHDGSWDFQTLADMLFSFWMIRAIPDTHKKAAQLLEVGIACAAKSH